MVFSQSEQQDICSADWDLPKEIHVELRDHFGSCRAYPINTTAVVFSHIAGTKTLTKSVLRDIAKLGFDFYEVHRGHLSQHPAESIINAITE